MEREKCSADEIFSKVQVNSLCTAPSNFPFTSYFQIHEISHDYIEILFFPYSSYLTILCE